MPIDKAHIYKSLVEQMNTKCQKLQMHNEQFVNRINKVKKIMRKRKRDVALLKSRLDKHKDNWRSVPMMTAPHPKRKIEQKRGPKPKIRATNTQISPASEDHIIDIRRQQQNQFLRQQQFQQQQNHQRLSYNRSEWSTNVDQIF